MLGWTEIPPPGKFIDALPTSPEEVSYGALFASSPKDLIQKRSYKDYAKSDFFKAILINDDPVYYITRHEEIKQNFTAMKNDLDSLLIDLQSDTSTLNKVTNIIDVYSKIREDMYIFNRDIIRYALSDNNPKTREEFTKKYNIQINDFELPNFNVLKHTIFINFEIGYKTMYETLKKRIEQKNNYYCTNFESYCWSCLSIEYVRVL